MPAALKGGDFILAAETGSGKTLAYLLPLIQSLKQRQHAMKTDRPTAPACAPLQPPWCTTDFLTLLLTARIPTWKSPASELCLVCAGRIHPCASVTVSSVIVSLVSNGRALLTHVSLSLLGNIQSWTSQTWNSTRRRAAAGTLLTLKCGPDYPEVVTTLPDHKIGS